MFSGDKTFLVIMLAVMVAGFVMLLLNHLRRNRLRRIGVQDTADVGDVKIERILRGDTSDHGSGANERKYTYTFYYTVDGNTYTRESVHESLEQRYNQGESVDILYNPDNPKEMMTAMEINSSSSQLRTIAPIFAVVFAVILYFLFKN